MSEKRISTLADFIRLLNKFEDGKISFKLDKYLADSISIIIAIPGERWEVDINQKGEVQVEKFKSNGEIFEASMIDELLKDFSD